VPLERSPDAAGVVSTAGKKTNPRVNRDGGGGTLLLPFSFFLLQLSISPEAGTGPFAGLHM